MKPIINSLTPSAIRAEHSEMDRLRLENSNLTSQLDSLRSELARVHEVLGCYHFDTSDIPSIVKAIIEGNIKTTAELARSSSVAEKYATAARVIALHLKQFCDESLSYDEMIADASRKASAELARRDEVEKELRERVVIGTQITSNGTALTYMGRTAGEWLEIDRSEKDLKELRELIKKSDLVEVDSCMVDSDSCGAPILRNSGKILRHKGYMAEVNEKTKLLQQLASRARENAYLRSRIGELEKLLKDLEGESFERDILG